MIRRHPTADKAAALSFLAAISMSLLGCAAASPPDGGVPLKQGGELAAWSPNSRLIAAPAPGKINVIDTNGSVQHELRVPGVAFSNWPCDCRLGWSKDASRILFMARQGGQRRAATVGSVAVDGGRVQQKSLGIPLGDATWSPDGWPLVFVANSGAYDFGASHRGPKPDLWRLDNLNAKPRKLLAQPGFETRPQFSPDGTKVLYLRKRGGWRSVWVVNADGSDPHQVSKTGWLAIAAWAPDSKQIVVAGAQGESMRKLYVASVAGGRLRRVPGTGPISNGLAWAPDGRWITYGGTDGKIWRIRPDGSRRQKIGDIPEHDIRRLLWSPDGKHLAYAAAQYQESD